MAFDPVSIFAAYFEPVNNIWTYLDAFKQHCSSNPVKLTLAFFLAFFLTQLTISEILVRSNVRFLIFDLPGAHFSVDHRPKAS